MKTLYTLAFASLALAGSAAYADAVLPSTGNGELTLFVRDLSNPSRIYSRGLGIDLNSILPETAITGTAGAGLPGIPQAIPYVFNGGNNLANAGLASFLSTPSAQGYSWTVIGGDSTAPTGQTPTNRRRYVTTQQNQYSVDAPSPVTGGNLQTQFGNLEGLIVAFNDDETTNTPGAAVINQQNYYGAGAAGEGLPSGWGTNSVGTANPLGTAARFYVFTSGGPSGLARVYQAVDIVLESTGALHAVVSTPTVPLPPAIWLLGSAIAGLTSIARKRSAAQSAA